MNGGKGFQPNLPTPLRIGQRFLVSFEDPDLAAAQYKGRLHDMSKEGFLCIDAPLDLRPPRGTAVTVSTLRRGGKDYSFSTEIQGRRRLKGRTPVFLLRPPTRVEQTHKRSAYRITVALRAQLDWREESSDRVDQSRPAVVTNLSGGGAQVFLRQLPDTDLLRLTLNAPTGFAEELAKRRRPGRDARPPRMGEPFIRSCEKINSHLADIQSQVVDSRVHLRDAKGTIYAVCLAFCEPQEYCYQLVRYLERQAIKKGIGEEPTGRAGRGRDKSRRPGLVDDNSDDQGESLEPRAVAAAA